MGIFAKAPLRCKRIVKETRHFSHAVMCWRSRCLWRAQRCVSRSYNHMADVSMQRYVVIIWCAGDVDVKLRFGSVSQWPSCASTRPAQDRKLRLTIFNDVAVSHLFNTLDCPLAANVICWRFRDCAGEAKRGPSGALKSLYQHGIKKKSL